MSGVVVDRPGRIDTNSVLQIPVRDKLLEYTLAGWRSADVPHTYKYDTFQNLVPVVRINIQSNQRSV